MKTTKENDDLMVFAYSGEAVEYEQKQVYAGSERIEQFTDKGDWERLLYVHEDVMGNTRYYTKENGQSFAELTYDAWGTPVSPNKLLNNDHGNFVYATFTGHIYDTTLDIYFAEARFYDAANRTWMAVDPVKDGLNWYQYCYGNPTTYWDPLGLSGWIVEGAGSKFAELDCFSEMMSGVKGQWGKAGIALYFDQTTISIETIEALENWINETNSIMRVGFISAKYEVQGFNPGKISSGIGDNGGVSYGIPQFSTESGSADKFVEWLKEEYPEMGNYFSDYKAGTENFSNAWKQVADEFGDEFGYTQTNYIYNTSVTELMNKAKEELGVDYGRSVALRELVYSTAVQFHSGELGISALGEVTPDMTDEEIINASYDKKIANYKNYFASSSPKVQEGVKERFINEREDVLSLVNR